MRGKKRGRFKIGILLDRMESFLYNLSSRASIMHQDKHNEKDPYHTAMAVVTERCRTQNETP